MGENVPHNVQRLVDLLIQRGPTSLEELLETDLPFSESLLLRLPAKFPSQLHLVDTRTMAAGARPIATGRELDSDHEPAHAFAGAVDLRSQSVVLDIETTGVDVAHCEVTDVAAIAWDGEILYADSVGDDRSEPDVLRGLAGVLEGVPLIVGQNVESFDLAVLATRSELHGIELDLPPVADTMHLSMLVWPTIENRRLDTLCLAAGVEIHNRHTALGDAEATRRLAHQMLALIDQDEPSWRLAAAALGSARHPLSGLLPTCAPVTDVDAALEPRPDELLDVGDHRPTSARDGVTVGLERLQSAGVVGERSGQRRMAEQVASHLDRGAHLAVEAPTGTGKTLAYLLGAGAKATTSPVIVATATRVLQSQLRDEALRLRANGLLGVPVRQLQGIGNYLCTREIAESFGGGGYEPGEGLALAVAARALATAQNGVWDDVTDGVMTGRQDYLAMRRTLRTTTDQCERANCAHAATCPYMMRIDGYAKNPGLVFTNHSMVASWIPGLDAEPDDDGAANPEDLEAGEGRAPRDAGHPRTSIERREASIIFDEAHELEDTMTSAWTEELAQIELLAAVYKTRSRRGLIRKLAAVPGGAEQAAQLRAAFADLEDLLDPLGDSIRVYVQEFGSDGQVRLIHGVARARREFKNIQAAVAPVRAALARLGTAVGDAIDSLDDVGSDQTKGLRRRLWGLKQDTYRWSDLLLRMTRLEHDHHTVYLLAVDQRSVERAGLWTFQAVPVDIGPYFERDIIGNAASLILTSATLRTGGTWDFIRRRLRLPLPDPDQDDPGSMSCDVISSPFDFARQSRVILTNHLPVPAPVNETEFVETMADDQLGFLSLSGGRSLTLFAARSRMEQVAELIEPHQAALAERGVRVVQQGQLPMAELIDQFRSEPGVAAFGLRSFWQGFDAPGETLSYLFIEKPPYPHPNDPVIAARQTLIQDEGGDPFLDYVVPKTAVLFAQGFGRLIRRTDDRGVAFVCDRRLQAPSPANFQLMASLPNPEVISTSTQAEAWSSAISFVTGVEPDLDAALRLRLDDVGELLEKYRLVDGEDPTEKLRGAAAEIFGIEELRDEQLEVMRAVAAGRDALGVLPTGFGKSLCFQLPALLHAEAATTVVVSPLKALIKDQVDDLRGKRRLRPVQGITGDTTAAVRNEILRDVNDGVVRLLYVSPERLVRDPVLRNALKNRQLGSVVIDEAHCVSVWGHDFRPEFRQIPGAVAQFERCSRVALTATATERVVDDIDAAVDLMDPVRVIRAADRPNLRFWVKRCDGNRERAKEFLRIIHHLSGTPGIVYTSKRSTSEELATLLRRIGVNARHYHAGLVPEQRASVQEQYLDGLVDVVVATKAFGMGINKPDISWVVHYDLPDSLDGYAQEAGRGARDPNLVGECVLLYTKADIVLRKKLVARESVEQLYQQCLTVLGHIERSPQRSGAHLLDSEGLCEHSEIELDELNRIVAWLERLGIVTRDVDATVRGTLTIGSARPEPGPARDRYNELVAALTLRPGVRRQFDLDELALLLDTDADELEQQLVEWTLDRIVQFSSSQRRWRVRRHAGAVDRGALATLLDEWAAWQRERLEAMIRFAERSHCRRAAVAEHFGHPGMTCEATGGQKCGVCSEVEAPWLAIPASDVPDPESLVDIRSELLRAVRWAGRFRDGNYSERNLKFALLGVTSLGAGRSLGGGILNCPQFGALLYLRSAQRRLEETINECIDAGLIERATAEYQGSSYPTLRLTPLGEAQFSPARAPMATA